jgi:sigma-B regulation protein RsbU (phosphoserine phosphatase)
MKKSDYNGETLFGRKYCNLGLLFFSFIVINGVVDWFIHSFSDKNGDHFWIFSAHFLFVLLPAFLILYFLRKQDNKLISSSRKLRESEDRYSSLFQNINVGMYLLNTQGYLIDANLSLEKIIGYTREELSTISFTQIILPEQLEMTVQAFHKVLNGETVTIEAMVTHKSGHELYLDVVGVPLIVEKQISGVIGIAKDITQLKEYEDKLSENEQRYRALFEQHPDAVYSFDLEGNFKCLNLASEKVIGYATEELLNTSFKDIIPPEDLPKAIEHFNLATSGIPQVFEIAVVNKQGERLLLNVTNVPIIIHQKVVGMYGIAKDITERKRMEQELITAKEQLKTIFDSLDVVVWSWDAKTEAMLHISSAADKVYGFPPEDFYKDKQLWIKAIHPDDSFIVEQMVEDEKVKNALQYEYRILHPNGEVKWVEDRVFPIFDKDGEQVVFRNGVTFDITKRKTMEYIILHDLYIARRVQQSVLPTFIHNDEIHLDAIYLPSRELGGDMYYWQQIDNSRYGILLMDVMGKGVSSSLISMGIRSLLQGLISKVQDPVLVIKELNQHMRSLFHSHGVPTASFFSAIYMLVDTEKGEIEYVNAGHPSALVLKEEEHVHLMESTCVPIGLLEDPKIEKQTFHFTHPVRVMLFTDGLLELFGNKISLSMKELSHFLYENRKKNITTFLGMLEIIGKEVKEDKEDKDDICVIAFDIKRHII